ncbi:MAG: insulinase family protein [Deltaproteobacteria bacterium CG_4_10_14_3_um_filter_60_8]|nr:MAG: hypothetical protein AUK28_06350 [Desulfobacterales bacterium CG2_30_60_27]PIP43045.1 MAG: peptidase M16 [Deltaproteobacteria bacterium CG23_combo_of_CG06-09_8_20_14_all_60_8]PIY24627.1 MAG: insulinase family protein [Deltaproteobacteria bacterium CG_4_10_14_3_um_filter_60_8]
MYQKTTLDNGVRIISERLPSATAALGIWIDAGSRDEAAAEAGCAHFVEHMLFKGTAGRSAQQIARELDGLGGMSNAFTSKENTCLYATVLDRHLPRLAELLSDLFLNSAYDPEELQRERQVILQEISMVEDTPDDQIHDLFTALVWPGHPMGREVLGNRGSVEVLDSERLQDFVRRHYTADRIVITAAGNVDHQELCGLFVARFGALAARGSDVTIRNKPPGITPGQRVVGKPLEQVHLITGGPGLSAASDERYTLYLLNILLGGNMSSRLFQEVREKHGLAYSIFSYIAAFVDCGYVGIYLGVDQQEVNRAMAMVNKEITRMWTEVASTAEMTNAREYAKGIMYLSAENMESRMTRLAHNEFQFGRHIPVEEVAAAIDGTTAEEVAALAGHLFHGTAMSTVVLGPITQDALGWAKDS